MTDTRQPEKTYGQWWESSEEQVTVRLSAVEKVGMAALREAGASEEDAAFLLSISVDKALQGRLRPGPGSHPQARDCGPQRLRGHEPDHQASG